MEKIIHKLINEFTEGVDTYTHNESTWLIFTETKQWVIELTENKTLWYNYNFFKSVFAYASLDCVQNQHLITKWVEDNIINKELTYVTLFRDARDRKQQFEDTLENGVKYTKMAHMKTDWSVEDTIENGVKNTLSFEKVADYRIEDTIENGVILTKYQIGNTFDKIDDIIENGVKETTALDPSFSVRYINGDFEMVPEVDKIIKGGVKETKSDDFNVSQFLCEEVIDKGVKETKYHMSKLRVDAYKAVDKGVKETKYNQSHQEPKFKEVLKNGVKETNHVDVMKFFDNKMEDTLKNGVKSSIPRQYVGENIIDKIIDKGELETYDVDWNVPTDLIEDVINDGVKKTMAGNYTDPSTSLLHIKWETQIEDVIDNGNKVCGTYVGGHRQEEKSESVIEYGKQI